MRTGTLVVKLPPGKPPFIGVTANYADLDIYDLVRKHKYAGYRIELDFHFGCVDLRLISDALVKLKSFTGLGYDVQQLKDWFEITKKAHSFNFGLVDRDAEGREIIFKIGGTFLFLPVGEIEKIDNSWRRSDFKLRILRTGEDEEQVENGIA